MNRTMLVAIALLLALPALSGCLGGDDTPKKETDEECPDNVCGDPVVDDDTGCVAGVVKDQDFRSIEGAQVTVRLPPDVEYSSTTGADGAYSFCKLAPGTGYTVVVTAPGHEPGSDQAEVKAGEKTAVDFLLAELPPAAVPHQGALYELNGNIGCAFAAAKTFKGDFCTNVRENVRTPVPGYEYPLRDPNNRNRFQVNMEAGISAVAMFLQADVPPPTSYPSSNMIYRVWWDNPPGEVIKPMVGPTGVNEVQIFEPAPWQEDPRGYPKKDADGNEKSTSPAQVMVELDNMGDPQFTFTHTFTLYVVFFYNGYPVPAGYSAKPDA